MTACTRLSDDPFVTVGKVLTFVQGCPDTITSNLQGRDLSRL